MGYDWPNISLTRTLWRPPPSFLFYLGVSLLYLINRQRLQQIDLVYSYNSVEWPLRSFKFQIETMRNFKAGHLFLLKDDQLHRLVKHFLWDFGAKCFFFRGQSLLLMLKSRILGLIWRGTVSPQQSKSDDLPNAGDWGRPIAGAKLKAWRHKIFWYFSPVNLMCFCYYKFLNSVCLL